MLCHIGTDALSDHTGIRKRPACCQHFQQIADIRNAKCSQRICRTSLFEFLCHNADHISIQIQQKSIACIAGRHVRCDHPILSVHIFTLRNRSDHAIID